MKSPRIGSFLLALSVFALPACAAEYSLDLNPENTKVQFTLSDVLHTVHGSFALRRGRIDFNTATGKADGQIVVDVTSGDTGNESRDSRMHASVFESKKYPDAVFVPDRIEGTLSIPGVSAVKLHGMFTIHGAPHEITMDVQTSGTADRFLATAAFDIPYVAWGMKDPSNFLLRVSKTAHMTIETSGPLRKIAGP